MRKATIKRIITCFLIVVLINTQLAFAYSETASEEQGYFLEVKESEIMDFVDDEESEDEIESIDESESELSEIRTSTLMRSNSSPYCANAFDAADYLDEQIINYLFYNGSSTIELFVDFDAPVSAEMRQALYYSKLYKAFCGYGQNLSNSYHFVGQYYYDGTVYFEFVLNIESTLTRSQILQTLNTATVIANQANLQPTYSDKVNYINDEINNRIDYHDECILITDDISPDDGCDTAYALCTGDGVCSGFTGAFCLICYKAGLNAVPISGFVKQPSDTTGGGHAWNLIKDGSKWKQVDCTFDDVLFGADTYATRGVDYYYTSAYKQNHLIDTTYNCWAYTSSGWTYIDSYGYPKTEAWIQTTNYWYYFEKDACMAASKWLEIGGEWYYFKDDGRMAANEWAQDNIGWCYLDSDGHIIKSAWIQNNGYWYYLNANGYMVTNEWIQDSTDWCYFGSDGKMVTNAWAQDNIGWCYLDSSGHITRSTWLYKNGEWYYLKADGHMAVNEWAQDSIGWCYMDSSGHITYSQWLQISGEWYYFKDDGHRATSEWAQDSIGWCYMDSNGHITKSAWIQKNGYWYYLKSTGYRAENEWVQDSTDWCYMGTDGRMVTSDWAQDSIGWCYMNSSGHITRSAWIQKDGYWYYLKANGYRAENEWAQDSIGYCWMYSDGRCESGTMWLGAPLTYGSRYILSGHRVDSQTIAIDGYNCTFNATGELIAIEEIE